MAIFYVRPNQSGNYGTGDGSSYANAWNGFESVEWNRLDVPGTSSTLWVCGTHLRRFAVSPADYGGSAYVSARRYDGLTIRGDYPGDPGVIDPRGLPYSYVNRPLTADEAGDLSRFMCGSNGSQQAFSVHLGTARNVTLTNLAIYVPGIPLACTPENHPGCDRMDLFYGPRGGSAPCAASPYNGATIVYPINIGVYSNSGSGNVRITACRIIGDKAYSRFGLGLQPFSANTSCSIDGNDISGCLKGINMDAGSSRSGLAWFVNHNTIHDMGFSAGDNDYVDGMDIYGPFNTNGNYAEIVGNDISGVYQDGIDLFYASGVLVKNNYIHDFPLAFIKYMDNPPRWNADENLGDQNGIKFGGDGGYSDQNRIVDNVVANIYGVGISNNSSGRNATISGNVVVSNNASMGGTGICCFGSGGGNTISDNVVIGFKRAIRVETNSNRIVNNLLQSTPKLPVYVNGSRPQADLLIHGGVGQLVGGNRLLNNLLVVEGGGSMQVVMDAREAVNLA